MNNLKIVAAPLDIVWTDIDENIYATSRILDSLDKDVDIVVLPELFSTGFITTPDLLYRFAAAGQKTLDQLLKWAEKYNFAIAGSILMLEGDKIFNRGFFIEPSGETTFYDKAHLFGLSSEASQFTAGKERIPVIRFRGWNIALAICYDLRFPAWLRNIDNSYDVLLVPANWPVKRSYAWQHLLIARAIENQAYVVGANRAGRDDSGDYDDMTYIYNYLGKPIGCKISEDSACISAVLDRDRLNAIRRGFPVADDADKFHFV